MNHESNLESVMSSDGPSPRQVSRAPTASYAARTGAVAYVVGKVGVHDEDVLALGALHAVHVCRAWSRPQVRARVSEG